MRRGRGREAGFSEQYTWAYWCLCHSRVRILRELGACDRAGGRGGGGISCKVKFERLRQCKASRQAKVTA